MPSSVTYSWVLQNPTIEQVGTTLTCSNAFLKCHGIEEEDFLSRFEVVLCEVLTNALKHGTKQKNGHVSLNISLGKTRAVITVSDPSSWHPSSLPSLPTDPGATSGRGMYLVQALSEKVIHSNRQGRHFCRVTMKLPSSGWRFKEHSEEISTDQLMHELEDSYELINGLLSMSEMLSLSYDTPSFFRKCLERLVFLTGVDGAFIRVFEEKDLRLKAFYPEPLGNHLPRLLKREDFPQEFSIIEKGIPTVIDNETSGQKLGHLIAIGAAAYLYPITIKDNPLGALILLYTGNAKNFFTAAKTKIIRMVAWYSAMLLTSDNLRRKHDEERLYLQEVELASKIQRGLTGPVTLLLPPLRIDGLCEPALLSGGDYFDIQHLEDGSVFAIVADVMGKGLTATLIASTLRAAVRNQLFFERDPGRLFTNINRIMFPDLDPVDMFITASALLLSPDRTSVRFCNAGHFPLFRSSPDGKIQQFRQIAPPLGINKMSHYSSESFSLREGDCVLMHTDGLVDVSDKHGVLVGETILQECLADRSQPGSVLEGITRRIFKNNSLHKSDDMTFVLLEHS